MPAAHVRGLEELSRAFKASSRELKLGLRRELRALATPVRVEAATLAADRIRNMTEPWAQMRIGVTSRLVYVAPRERGARGGPRKRGNLAPLLLERAMEPALEGNREEIVRGLEAYLDRLVVRQGF